MIEKKIGRPSKGVTKKVSLTLPEWAWKEIDRLKGSEDFGSVSAILRRFTLDTLIENGRMKDAD